MCQAPSKTIVTTKTIFMDVDLPLYVYENETVPVHVLIISDASLTQERKVRFQ